MAQRPSPTRACILVVAAVVLLFPSFQGATFGPLHPQSRPPGAAVPSGGSKAPSNTYTLSPSYYEYFSFYGIVGTKVSLSVVSSVSINTYVMTQAQFAQFQAYSATQAVYTTSGASVSSTVVLPSSGNYVLVTWNDGTSTASVTTGYSLDPAVPSYVAGLHSAPAPLGIADYGVMNSSGVLEAYSTTTSEVVGSALIDSIGAYNGSSAYTTDTLAHAADLQLNVMLQVNTTEGSYTYWLQNVVDIDTQGQALDIGNNIWNSSAAGGSIISSLISGQGTVGSYRSCTTCPAQSFYYYFPGSIGTATATPYTLPLNLTLPIRVSHSSSAATVVFGYSMGRASTVNYDTVTISDSGITAASILVDGYAGTPTGNTYYDNELVFGGECCGLQTTFTSLNAKLNMKYLIGSALVEPKAIWPFGSDTAEGTYNVVTRYSGGSFNVGLGTPSFHASFLPGVPLGVVKFTPQAVATDAGLPFSYSFTLSVQGGTAPYTYMTYLAGKSVSNYTSTSSDYSGSFTSAGLGAGAYAYDVVVVDAIGSRVTTSNGAVTINPAPSVAIAGSAASDAGLAPSLTASPSNGTPPYTFSWTANGAYEGSTLPQLAAGSYVIQVSLTDSAGSQARSAVFTLVVNPDPTVALGGKAFADAGQNLTLQYTGSLGTPPYSVSWVLNGAAQTGVPSGLGPGTYSVQAVLRDAAGYEVKSAPFSIDVRPDPTVQLSGSGVMDQGEAPPFNYTAALGSPPYTVEWSANGTSVPSIQELSPGHYSVRAVLSDSAGYRVTSSPFDLTVNAKPTASSSSASPFNFLYSNGQVTVTESASGGTPPYHYEWFLNGVQVGNTTAPSFTFDLTSMGDNTLAVKVVDGAGYAIQSQQSVSLGYNYTTLGSTAVAVIAVAALAAYFVLRRGKAPRIHPPA